MRRQSAVVMLAIAGSCSCALAQHGVLVEWGECNQGSYFVEPPQGLFKDVATGWGFSVALRSDGSLASWGWAVRGNIYSGVPNGNDFVAVAAAYFHAVALRQDGSVVAWGEGNTYPASSIRSPLHTPTGPFIAIAAGEEVNAAIRTDGTLLAWGENYCFQPVDMQVPGAGTETSFSSISGSGHHFVAKESGESGMLRGWGPGPVCNSSNYTSHNQAAVPSGYEIPRQFAAGHAHSFVIRQSDGAFHGWGLSNWGQTGVAPSNPPTSEYVAPPVPMPALRFATGGYHHGVGLTEAGQLIGWGRNSVCQAQPPSAVPTYGSYLRVSSSYNHGVALRGLSCYANCDQSTGSPVLTANDFACFLNMYAVEDPLANCDGSTGTPVLTANDYQCFLNAYAQGCP